MSVTLKGVSSTALVVKGSVLRITLGKAYSLLNDDFFADKVSEFWHGLDLGGKAYTISPNPHIVDGKPAIIDARISTSTYMSELAVALETLSGFYTDVVEIELLKPEDAKQSASNKGAEQREEVKKEAAEKADDGSFAGMLASVFGVAKTVVTVALVGGVIVALIVYAPQLKAVAKRAGVK
jgi:hypothetical protein